MIEADYIEKKRKYDEFIVIIKDKISTELHIEPLEKNTLENIQRYLYRGAVDQWKILIEFNLEGYLTYIHERHEIEKIAEHDIDWKSMKPKEFIEFKKSNIFKYECHLPAMLHEASFLCSIAKYMGYDFNPINISFYNEFVKSYKENNQVIINNSEKSDEVDRTEYTESLINKFFEKLRNINL